MSGIVGDMEYREQLSFSKCPVCGGELSSGRANVYVKGIGRIRFNSVGVVYWYNEDKVQEMLEKPSILRNPYFDAKTYFDFIGKCPIPAGYCISCKKIFAELDIKDEDEPIGTEYEV